MNEPSPSNTAIESLRFLVVEDHGYQRWIMGNILSGLGAKHVLSAADGQAALDILESVDHPIDVIVSDLDMPAMDGMEFMRHLGERKADAAVILVSGLDRTLIASVESMAREYGVGLLAAIQKPATPKKIEAAVAGYRRRAPFAGPRHEPAAFTTREIQAAVKNDEFEPFFQPKVGLDGARVAGAEALARWRHPERGIVPAGAFMDVVGDPALDERLALTITRKAARSCREWRIRGLPGTVSVNLSPGTLASRSLAERLLEVVSSEDLASRHMTFEVTESGAVGAQALENLSRLRMNGFGLSIDDYGIGYSSMERLTRIAFTELKIDRVFVRDATVHAATRAMLESSLEMARKLGIAAVAEGVERQVEWELLRELRCDYAQGFLVSRPLDQAAYLDWLRRSAGRL